MRNMSSVLVALATLSGCVTQDGEGGGFTLKSLTAECRGLAHNNQYVLRPTPQGPIVFATGKCRATDGGDGFRVVGTEAIILSPNYARVRVSDKLGRRELLVRRNYSPYRRAKFTFAGRWIEKAPE